MVTQVYVEGQVVSAYARILPPKYIQNLQVRPAENSDNMPAEVSENMSALNNAARKITYEYVNLLSEFSELGQIGVDDLPGNPSGDLPKSKQGHIMLNHFSDGGADNMQQFPQFSQDFHINFEPRLNTGETEKYRMSHIDVDSSHQYCSIERVYSEAFHLEVSSDLWNSDAELDRAFSDDRGGLLRRVNVNFGPEYEFLATNPESGMASAYRHLESLHFF